MVRPLMKNKAFGAFLVFTGAAAFALIVLRVVFYQFRFDPQYYPVDYGRFNFFSFFTVQSNLYVCFYLVTLGCAVFGAKRAHFSRCSPICMYAFIWCVSAVPYSAPGGRKKSPFTRWCG